MKINADNTLKLARNERRVGNFVIKDEENHIKVMDIGSLFTHRVSKGTPIGTYLKLAYDDLAKGGKGIGLGNWIAVIFSAFSTVPDLEFLTNIYDASKACIERHPEVYGYPKERVSDEEDARIIEEERELKEFEEKVKQMPDGDDDKKD